MSNVIQFPTDNSRKIKCVTIYGPAVVDKEGKHFSPRVEFDFDNPQSSDSVKQMLQAIVERGCIEADDDYAIFWPPATIHFDYVDK